MTTKTDTAQTLTLTHPQPYTLPALPYGYEAFAGILSEQAMHLHHDKHHAAYVTGANTTLEKLHDLAPESDPSGLLDTLAFNLSGHQLHSLYWECLTPGSSAMSKAMTDTVEASFGTVGAMQGLLSDTVVKLAGSGWAALVWEPVGERLVVTQIHDHHNRSVVGGTPVLVIDAWEHAYYLDYLNEKAKWAKAFFEIADWAAASARLTVLMGG
jgi:superoxide dismutase, Fe-Mn family